MRQRPLIGITGRRRKASEVAHIPEGMKNLNIDLYFTGYSQHVEAAGGIGIYLTRDGDSEIIERLDGLLLTGGADINPAIYEASPDPNLGPIEVGRDEREFPLLTAAIEAEIPVLGICRGIQVLNVHAGGTLHQHIAEHACLEQPCFETAHQVYFKEGSLAEQLYGSEIGVNSLHHQAINDLGSNLQAVGWSKDGTSGEGIVEAVESDDGLRLGVQWHPEMMIGTDPGFRWLIEKANL